MQLLHFYKFSPQQGIAITPIDIGENQLHSISCTEQSEGNISSLTGSGIQDCDCAGCGIEDLLEVV